MPNYIEPFGFILLRAATACVFFWTVHRFFVQENVARSDFGRLILCGLFGVAINQLMFFKGLNWTTPINAALIMTTTPVLVLVTSALLIGERITWRKVVGVSLGITGAILIILYGGTPIVEAENQFLGDIFIFINATSYGIYLVLVKSLMRKYHPMTVIKWVFTFGFFFVIPFGFNEFRVVEWSTFPVGIWLAVLYVLLGATFLAYLLNAAALKALNPSVVSIYIYLQPVLATIIALIFGKDALTLQKALPSVLIFIGVYLVSSAQQSRAK